MRGVLEGIARVQRDVAVLADLERADAVGESEQLGGLVVIVARACVNESPFAAVIAASSSTTRTLGTYAS